MSAEVAEPSRRADERRRMALEVIEREGEMLRWTARRISLCADDADDAYQRAMVILLTRAPSMEPAKLARWMQVVVGREALGVRRQREQLLGGAPEPGEEPFFLEDAQAEELGPEERLEVSERLLRGGEALGSLKPSEVRCLALKGGGYTYGEIGEMTGWSTRRVNRLLSRGRRRLLDVSERIESGDRCQELNEALAEAAVGEAGARAGELRRHLIGCAPCRAELRAQRGGVPALPLLVPGIAGLQSWVGRLHDSVATAIGERTTHAAWRIQQLGEAASAQKAAVAVAVTAAAGGGTAVVKVEHDLGPKPAITQAAAVTAAPAIPASPPTVPASAAVGPLRTPEEIARVARERRQKARAAARLKQARRAPTSEFGPDAAGQALGGTSSTSSNSKGRAGARSASAAPSAPPPPPSTFPSGAPDAAPTSPAPPPPEGSTGRLPQGGSDEFGP